MTRGSAPEPCPLFDKSGANPFIRWPPLSGEPSFLMEQKIGAAPMNGTAPIFHSGETQFRRKFFAKLSFKKAQQGHE